MAGVPFKLTPEDMGVTDLTGAYQDAFAKGLQGYLQSKYQPRILENQAKKGEITNEYLPREKESNLAHQGAQTQGLNLSNQWAPRMNQSTLDNAALNRRRVEMEVDPGKKMQYYADLYQQMMSSPFMQESGGGGGGGADDGGQMQAQQTGQNPFLSALMAGGNPQMGADESAQPSNGGAAGGMGFGGQGGQNAFQQQIRNQMMKAMGFDPNYQSPEQKQQQAIDLYQQKLNLKSQQNLGDTATHKVLSQNQEAVQGIDASIPIIDDIINDKDLPGITTFSPAKNAAYNAKTGAIIDKLIAAQGLPKVQASIDLVAEQIRRQRWESVDDYKNRLRTMRNDLLARRKMATDTLQTRKIATQLPGYANEGNKSGVSAGEDFSNMSDDELRKIAGGG